ncbi:TIGR00645 family protein [Hydrogenophaga sp.]|uniref:TIGR00645 family protein n=1 Tax=Hydrogenophaga sp. TaxID=1904254 RepID=UPI0025BB8B3E|nr:TIGR00645 family protein [Hydrogenophaga sp.]
MTDPVKTPAPIRALPNLICASRWLQLPLYIGLIAAKCVYVFHFWVELVHLQEAAFGSQIALDKLISSIRYKPDVQLTGLNGTVIIGGYETFVSRMHLENHPDQPEWLSHVNASLLKVKLATAIIGISSIHLLKTFINAANYTEQVLMWQTIIHVVFLLSAMAIAMTDKLMQPPPGSKH